MTHTPSSSEISPVMQQLSRYMADARERKLPEEVSERAKIHLIDTFGAMLSGSRLGPGKRAIAYLKTLGGNREAGVIGTRIVTSATQAALANGICAHADETDDVHPASRQHTGACIVPATLAMAEREQTSGVVLLRALVLGYEIGTRVLLALKHDLVSKTGFHPSSKGGIFGAGAAAGALLKLDARKMRHMFAYCAEQAAGLLIMHSAKEHLEKAYATGGMPAQNGVTAALMAASGFTGVEDVLSGEGNVLSVFSSAPESEALVRGLGQGYEILRCAIKFWPAGAPIQAPLHVLRDLLREHAVKADDVEKLTVRMPDKQLEVVNNRDMANITVQHLLAVMLLDGSLTFAAAHDDVRIKDRKVIKIRERIEALGDGRTDLLRNWRCAMEITLKDGRKLSHHTENARGSLDNPLTRKDVEEKALDLIAPVLGKKCSAKLIAALFDIEKMKDVRILRRLYSY